MCMARKGLSKEKILVTAIRLIREKGYKEFSMRTLAAQLDIKAASLYYYFENINEILIEIGLQTFVEFNELQERALQSGKTRQEGILALAVAYREFALANPELYKVIMTLPIVGEERIAQIIPELIRPMKQAMALYQIDEEQQMHWQRILRATVTGFVTREVAGFFVALPVDTSESYRLAIMNIIAALESLESAGRNRTTYLLP